MKKNGFFEDKSRFKALYESNDFQKRVNMNKRMYWEIDSIIDGLVAEKFPQIKELVKFSWSKLMYLKNYLEIEQKEFEKIDWFH